MASSLLLIDGENFLHKVDQVFKDHSIKAKARNLPTLDLQKMFLQPLQGMKYEQATFYAAKLREWQDSLTKSRELILWQRALKTRLEKQGFEFVIAGNVRPQIDSNGKNKTVFHEKGVDVRIAVDMVSMACDKKVERIILCSSDSDLQPAIAEVKRRKVEVIYMGFESRPNKGIMYTADRTILLRDNEVLSSCGIVTPK